MKSFLLLFLITLMAMPPMLSQVEGDDEFEISVPDPLPQGELDRQGWYYSLADAIREPEKVYKLSLNKESLKRFPQDILRLRRLQVLMLSRNKIKEIPPEIRQLKNLQILVLSNNKIVRMPEEISELKYLREVYLNSNRLHSGVPAWVGGLGQLRKLDVSGNGISIDQVEKLKATLPKCRVTY